MFYISCFSVALNLMTSISLAVKLAQSLQVSNRQVIGMGSWFLWSVHFKAVRFLSLSEK